MELAKRKKKSRLLHIVKEMEELLKMQKILLALKKKKIKKRERHG